MWLVKVILCGHPKECDFREGDVRTRACVLGEEKRQGLFCLKLRLCFRRFCFLSEQEKSTMLQVVLAAGLCVLHYLHSSFYELSCILTSSLRKVFQFNFLHISCCFFNLSSPSLFEVCWLHIYSRKDDLGEVSWEVLRLRLLLSLCPVAPHPTSQPHMSFMVHVWLHSRLIGSEGLYLVWPFAFLDGGRGVKEVHEQEKQRHQPAFGAPGVASLLIQRGWVVQSRRESNQSPAPLPSDLVPGVWSGLKLWVHLALYC